MLQAEEQSQNVLFLDDDLISEGKFDGSAAFDGGLVSGQGASKRTSSSKEKQQPETDPRQRKDVM